MFCEFRSSKSTYFICSNACNKAAPARGPRDRSQAHVESKQSLPTSDYKVDGTLETQLEGLLREFDGNDADVSAMQSKAVHTNISVCVHVHTCVRDDTC